KVLELVTEVGDVVRHDQSSGGNQGQDHLQIAVVVLLPGVNEHKLERTVKLGNEFERVAAPKPDQRSNTRRLKVLLGKAGATLIYFEGRQMAACLAQSERDPDARIAIGSPDFECVLGADFPNLVAQERALAGRDVPEALLVLAHPGKPLLGPFDGLRVFDAGFVAPSSLLLTPQS